VVQAALSGHAIPIDSGTAGALHLVDLASDADVAAGVVPGLDRAIPKTSGPEFGSLVHQLGADFTASPYSPAFHAILVEIDPSAKARLPSWRGPKRPVPEAPAPAAHDGSDAKTAKDASDAKAARSKPGKASQGDARKEPAEAHEAGPGPTAAVAKDGGPEAAPEAKKKPVPAKRKTAADATPAEATGPVPDVLPRKKEQEPIEDAAAAEKPKQASPPKKTTPKKKAEESKGKNPPEPDREPEGLEGISKRKPR
jgi:hypothetical protein